MNIAVVIPIHEYNEKIADYLKSAIQSVDNQKKGTITPKIILVGSENIKDNVLNDVEKFEIDVNYEYIVNNENLDFQSQINLVAKKIRNTYFTILEFDDEFNDIYLRDVKQYIDSVDADIYLPIILEVNDEKQGLKMTNQLAWSQQFVGENGVMGFLNKNSLKQNTDFKISGAIINRQLYNEIGGLKSNIKLTFTYEFLLRALINGLEIFNVPKLGYMHNATREGSLFDYYSKNMPMNERKFWFDVATKECSFTNDREIDLSLLDTNK